MPIQKTVALCYIRLSMTREDSDSNSPDRQRANIIAECERRGLTPEFHQDIEGHKSGTGEVNRPGWMALKERLNDPDVAALVANDLARLHRKGWRVGQLIDMCDQHRINLILVQQNLDLSTQMGRMFAMMAAIFDEWYAADISRRMKDSVAHRKSVGKPIALLPGTKRAPDGYLAPSTDGAWWLEDGSFIKTPENESLLPANALWRGYFDGVRRALEIYAEDRGGFEYVAERVNSEGWPFKARARKGQPSYPRVFRGWDIQRIVSLYPEYGGLAPEKSSRKRSSAYAVKLNPERSLFPVEFLESVSLVYSRRSEAAQTLGGNPNRYQYALNGLVRCGHCQKSFWGKISHGVHCYRHQDRVSCTCTRRIVPAHKVEHDVEAILEVLKVKDVDALAKAVATLGDHKPSKDFAKEIDQCQRRMKAAVRLFRDGQMDEQEYDSTLAQNREWIAEYEQKSSSINEKTNRIRAAADTMNHLNMAWHGASSKTRQDIAKSIFKWIEYDLDTQRIVEFELKPWVNEVMEVLGNLAPYYAPKQSQTEPLFSSQPEISFHFAELIAYPQRSALEPLLHD